MKAKRLFHISETPGIKKFIPKPSPSVFKEINGNVVFAIIEKLLHNYLLPRDCPRVTYYAKEDSLHSDIEKFLGKTAQDFVVAVETKWRQAILRTKLYCNEFEVKNFLPLDEGAGYYISYNPEVPVSMKAILNPISEIARRNAEIRFMPSLSELADEISKSSLQYSLIRMRNASSK